MAARVHVLLGKFAVLMLLACSNASCEHDSLKSSSSHGSLEGVWSVARIEAGSTITKEQSMLVGLMSLLDSDDQKHTFTGSEYFVTDASGTERHRWKYHTDGGFLVIEADTCELKWISDSSFTLSAQGVEVQYQRFSGK